MAHLIFLQHFADESVYHTTTVATQRSVASSIGKLRNRRDRRTLEKQQKQPTENEKQKTKNWLCWHDFSVIK